MRKMGVHNYFGVTGSGFLENVLSLTFAACILSAEVMRFLQDEIDHTIMALASVVGWMYILFFLLAIRLTGPFVVMIWQMLFTDVVRFCSIYMVFLAAFSQAFFILYQFVGFEGFFTAVKTCFSAMLGDFDLEAAAETPFQTATISLLILYVVLVTILLLNLLIAMMGDTYGRIIEDADKKWHLERARVVTSIENEMTASERDANLNKYWTVVDKQRYLQVQEVDEKHFASDPEEEEDSKDKESK